MNTKYNTSRSLHWVVVRLGIIVTVFISTIAHAQILNPTYRGFVTSNGQTSDTLGQGNSYEAGFAYSTVTRRNYFYFAIPTLAPGESITAARLTLTGGTLNLEGTTTRTVTLWDVSTGIGQIGFAYSDIGSGASYGSFQVSRSDPIFGVTAYNADLNGTAIANLNSAAGGLFAIGGTLDVFNNSVSRYQVFANTGGSAVDDGRTVLSLTVVPEPSVVHLIAATTIALVAARFLKKLVPRRRRVAVHRGGRLL
jgi:hypothetical protein